MYLCEKTGTKYHIHIYIVLSESEPLIMRPKNLTGLEWIEGISDEDSG